VDDCAWSSDGPEVPILDGSSRPFVDGILAAGRRSWPPIRQYLTIVRPSRRGPRGEDDLRATAPEYRGHLCHRLRSSSLGYQELTASLWSAQQFAEKLAPARTFAFEHEVDALRKAGWAWGAR
jgi:UDP-3-O-[3-hydroxymyristoyl] N-acetylglucosamine deacetylase